MTETNEFYQQIEQQHQQLDSVLQAFDDGHDVESFLMTRAVAHEAQQQIFGTISGSITPNGLNGILQSVYYTSKNDKEKLSDFINVIVMNTQLMLQAIEADEIAKEMDEDEDIREFKPIDKDEK